jgi:hypothetical protein
MKRTVWTIFAALSLAAGAGCKDSNQNYIGFDAQASDVRPDVPADGSSLDVATDGGHADGSHADDVRPDSPPDSGVGDGVDGSDSSDGSDGSANAGDSADAEQGQ